MHKSHSWTWIPRKDHHPFCLPWKLLERFKIEGRIVKRSLNQPYAILADSNVFAVIDLRTGKSTSYRYRFEVISADGKRAVVGLDSSHSILDLESGKLLTMEGYINWSPLGDAYVGKDNEGHFVCYWTHPGRRYYLPKEISNPYEIVLSYDASGAAVLIDGEEDNPPEMYYWEIPTSQIHQIALERYESYNSYEAKSTFTAGDIEISNFSNDGNILYILFSSAKDQTDHGENDYLIFTTHLATYENGIETSSEEIRQSSRYAYPDFDDPPDYAPELDEVVSGSCNCYYHPFLLEYHPLHPIDSVPILPFDWKASPAGMDSLFPSGSMPYLVIDQNRVHLHDVGGEKICTFEYPDVLTKFKVAYYIGDLLVATTTEGETVIWDVGLDRLGDRYQNRLFAY